MSISCKMLFIMNHHRHSTHVIRLYDYDVLLFIFNFAIYIHSRQQVIVFPHDDISHNGGQITLLTAI
jgi:hypothetical protein